MDITEFVRARLDEEQALAEAAANVGTPEWTEVHGRIEDGNLDIVVYDEGSPRPEEAVHIATQDPARTLRRVAAMRAVLAVHTDRDEDEAAPAHCYGCGFGSDEEPMTPTIDECPTLRALALAWADHPDYQREWVA